VGSLVGNAVGACQTINRYILIMNHHYLALQPWRLWWYVRLAGEGVRADALRPAEGRQLASHTKREGGERERKREREREEREREMAYARGGGRGGGGGLLGGRRGGRCRGRCRGGGRGLIRRSRRGSLLTHEDDQVRATLTTPLWMSGLVEASRHPAVGGLCV
jgi:hypothetical protein